MRHLFLFDIDSVLVDPQGYLKALQDTVAHFTRLMGVGELPPSAQEVRAFEAHGLTSEWDSAAACVAHVLLERLAAKPPSALPDILQAALSALAEAPLTLPPPAYGPLAQRIGALISPGTTVPEAALAVLWQDALTGEELAPVLPDLGQVLEQLLGHTYDFHRSPTTRHFQHLVLGDQAIRQTYGVEPDFDAAAYLDTFHTRLIEERLGVRLHEASSRGALFVALYTARPCLPPSGAGTAPLGYSPEAEMARALARLDAFPIVGLGSLRWLAGESGESVDHLVKPSPVQALAAIGTAASGEVVSALRAAYALRREGKLRPPLRGLGDTTVHVFEDAPVGVEAARRAVRLLGRKT